MNRYIILLLLITILVFWTIMYALTHRVEHIDKRYVPNDHVYYYRTIPYIG